MKGMGSPFIDGKYKGYTYSAKVYNGGSKFGINGGRVSKLWISKSTLFSKKWVVEYDRGWSIKPRKGSIEEEIMYEIVEMLDDMEELYIPDESW